MDNYEIVTCIGQGSSGAVYLARSKVIKVHEEYLYIYYFRTVRTLKIDLNLLSFVCTLIGTYS